MMPRSLRSGRAAEWQLSEPAKKATHRTRLVAVFVEIRSTRVQLSRSSSRKLPSLSPSANYVRGSPPQATRGARQQLALFQAADRGPPVAQLCLAHESAGPRRHSHSDQPCPAASFERSRPRHSVQPGSWEIVGTRASGGPHLPRVVPARERAGWGLSGFPAALFHHHCSRRVPGLLRAAAARVRAAAAAV